jgi:hypothetical protein
LRNYHYHLSVPTEESPREALSLKVVHQSHKETAPVLAGFFGCKENADLRNGLGYANGRVDMIPPSGTHLDVPGIMPRNARESRPGPSMTPSSYSTESSTSSGKKAADNHGPPV